MRAKGMIRAMALVASLLTASAAQASIVVNLEFNVDGLLPSSEPNIGLANNTGNPESALYSVSGGLLQQRTLAVNGNASYGFPDASFTGGGIDPSQGFSMEARLRVLDIDGRGGAFFQAFNGIYRYIAAFSSGAVELFNGAAQFEVIALDITEFHTYRFETADGGNAFDFLIDGSVVFSGNAVALSTFNGFNFGDDITDPGFGANADWDYIRFEQPIAAAEVPEPGAAALFALGMGWLAAVRRRRRA